MSYCTQILGLAIIVKIYPIRHLVIVSNHQEMTSLLSNKHNVENLD